METNIENIPGSLCPAMASADLMGDKWTLLILREMFLGATRFSEFQRAQPRMSPTILSKRLKMLEANDIIVRKNSANPGANAYRLTRSGRELGPIIEGMAVWGMRWRSRHIVAQDCDVGGFMWDFHRTVNTQALPDGDTVIHVDITDRSELNSWWLLANAQTVDLCPQDPGYDIDIYINATLKDLITVWMGDISLKLAIQQKRLQVTGARHYVNTAGEWFPQSPLADIRPAERPGL